MEMKQHSGDEDLKPVGGEMILEELLTRPQFDALLATAVELCLSEPLPAVETPDPPTDEQRLIMQLGARGLRDALTVLRLGEHSDHQTAFGPGDDMAIRNPEVFGWGQDPELLQRVEAFGAALLDEAYTVLGADVEEKIAAFREATTPEEKTEVLAWLCERQVALSEGSVDQDEDGNLSVLMYHPVRLSPKLIGQYPEIKFPPTCLGHSIIAASFFRAAGAPVMHAGVVRSKVEDDAIGYSNLAALASRETQQLAGSETELSQALKYRQGEVLDSIRAMHETGGYHAVALVRLYDSLWCQIDSNWNANTLWNGRKLAIRDLDPVYEQLQEFKDVAPNLEIAVYGGSESPSVFCAELGFYQDDETLAQARQPIAQELLAPDTDTLRVRLYDRLADVYRAAYDHEADVESEYFGLFDDRSETRLNIRQYDEAGNDVTPERGPLPDTEFGKKLEKLIDKYVFYGYSAEEVVARCRQDEAFLQRRVDDVLSLLFAVRASADAMSPGSQEDHIHHMLEVGNVEMRVGFAVLSDIATFFGSDMSHGFWYGHWPSLVPVGERADDPRTDVESCLAVTNKLRAKYQTLTYLRDRL